MSTPIMLKHLKTLLDAVIKKQRFRRVWAAENKHRIDEQRRLQDHYLDGQRDLLEQLIKLCESD